MKPAAQGPSWRRPLAWCVFLLAVVLAAFGAARVGPELPQSAFAPALGCALSAYLVRRRWSDAALLGGAVFAADLVEIGFASYLLAALVLPVLAVTRRPRFALVTGALAFALLLAGLALKPRFAGSPLTWQDVHFFFLRFGDNVGVLASQPTLLLDVAIALGVAGALGWAAWRWDRPVGDGVPLRPRGTAIALALVVATFSGAVVDAQGQAMARAGSWNLGQSFELNPLQRFFATTSQHPEWHGAAVDTTAFRAQVRGTLAAHRPEGSPGDIVVILQESQFNPASIAGCAALCDIPVFRAPPDAWAQGPLQVHVFGGGTWLTEFALATGVPHRMFGPSGDFAPFNVAPGIQRSFIRSLKAAGYRTVAVYPVSGGMMNARLAYEGYGFDRFYEAGEVGLPSRFDNADEQMHAAARRVLAQERQGGRPVFLLLVTIFNHGEHGIQMARVPAAFQSQAAERFGDGVEARNVADYVWRTTEFERALVATRSAVLDAGRPAVLAWFGDHLPPFANALSLRERVRTLPAPNGRVPALYQTWFQVATNRPGRGRGAASTEALDIVFLPGVLAEAADVPLDDWLAANVVARKACGGLLQSCREPAARAAYFAHLWQDLHAFALP